MSKAKLVLCICLLFPMAGHASEYDQYKLESGDSISGWVVAADGEKILLRNKDGDYCLYSYSELSGAANAKIEDLRKEKDIVHMSQHVEASNADPDRWLIPTYDQGSFDQNWGCVANASINFLIWWDRIGVCRIPEEGTEDEKAEWLHDRLYAYVKTFDGGGSNFSKLSSGLKMFFEEYPSDNYTFEYDIISLKDNPGALAENAKGLNMTALMMSKLASGQRKSGHAVSLIQATENKGIAINTWGKTYMAQLYEPCGLHSSSEFADGSVWDIDFTSTCPPDFDKDGCRWTVHRYDYLFVVRPVRRPDAPPKLVDGPPGKESGAHVRRYTGDAWFGKHQALKYQVEKYDLMYGECRDSRFSVRVNGENVADYIFAFAPSKIRYRIPENVSTFTALGTSLWSDNVFFGQHGKWCYIVEIDGKEVFRSRPLEEYADGVVPISVAIPEDAEWIELIAYLHNRYGGEAVWAIPEFK